MRRSGGDGVGFDDAEDLPFVGRELGFDRGVGETPGVCAESGDLGPEGLELGRLRRCRCSREGQHELIGECGGHALDAVVAGSSSEVLGDDDVGVADHEHHLEADRHRPAAVAAGKGIGRVDVEHLSDVAHTRAKATS